MMQYNKSVILLPYHDKNKINPLITARDIPTEVEEFGIYIPAATVYNRSNVLFMKFKTQSNMLLNKLKQVKGMRNFLDRRNVYLDQMYLTSSDNAKIGGFIMSHCQYTRREQVNRELNDRINESETTHLTIKLTQV